MIAKNFVSGLFLGAFFILYMLGAGLFMASVYDCFDPVLSESRQLIERPSICATK